ncbi:cytochrome P450 [Streptomyces sp. SID13031]|uniref:cytochrome P450 n=1 Tax=Streptomyces sp. SID13031 TaxID=2706046 RepID=UPI0013C6AF02|nr:cytochrome P450 [Streptomyces sp. SID13031]NEA30986.1 cytochrome P450 [Streptomyces sp. SID13031]
MTDATIASSESTLNEPFPWERPQIDPPDVYAWLREERPVVRVVMTGGTPAWLVTRYDDVRAVLSDPRVSADSRNPGFPGRSAAGAGGDDLQSFLRMDPPDHTLYRRLLTKNFMVKRVEALRPRIQELVDRTIDAMLAGPKPADFVQAVALPVPSTVLSWILGVREEDRGFFNKTTEELFNTGEGTPEEQAAKSVAAANSLVEYVSGLAAERRKADDPGDDILGQLVRAAAEGTISERDVINTGFVLTVAGHDTTASMTALGTLTLLQHPEQLAELREKPELIPAAIEELLRYLTIVHLIILRVATEDIEIGGTVIPAGEGIIPLNLSANRDDAHFPDAAKFDIHRNARDHFAFGYGMHQCIGQPLARVELHVIFDTLLRRIPTLQLAEPVEQLQFKSQSPINGVFRLPVTW